VRLVLIQLHDPMAKKVGINVMLLLRILLNIYGIVVKCLGCLGCLLGQQPFYRCRSYHSRLFRVC
jgi:hypothetical protein